MNKLIVILGSTASGKSELALKLAKKFGGEIVSADSRQVYKGLDIGSAKPTKQEREGITHHVIDVAPPRRRFTVAQYQIQAQKAVRDIQKRDKLPFLVGGSPLYIYAVVDGWVIPKVKPNLKLRKKLEKQSIGELFSVLKTLDPRRAKTLQQSSGQAKNKRRLIRSLEIVLTTGKPVPPLNIAPWYDIDVLIIGIKKSPQELKKRIKKRFLQMLKQGFLSEAKALRKKGLSWKRIEGFGLEYREAAHYLQGKISKQEMIERAIKATEQFARRQMAWFKKDQRIRWITTQRAAEKIIEKVRVVSTVKEMVVMRSST